MPTPTLTRREREQTRLSPRGRAVLGARRCTLADRIALLEQQQTAARAAGEHARAGRLSGTLAALRVELAALTTVVQA